MIEASSFVEALRARGFALYTGVPCSYLKPFINYVIDDESLTYVGAANEGEAVAIASGAALGGTRSVVMFQNSGLGNAVNPLTSLSHTLRIPTLVIVTWRGEPGGAPDEPQHARMGAITTRLLELMDIPWEPFPEEASEIGPVLERALAHMDAHKTPYALVMRKGAVAPHPLSRAPAPRPAPGAPPPAVDEPSALPSRREVLEAVRAKVPRGAVFVATTGFTARELYALGDREDQLYVVGSMGCASSVGLGVALARPERPVIVLDGDGAALMHLGALPTLGHERPRNLTHVLLDNQAHESTGGQATVSGAVDFAGLAAASGYPRVVRAPSAASVAAEVARAGEALRFVHARIRQGTTGDLPRPSIPPDEVARRFSRFLASGAPADVELST